MKLLYCRFSLLYTYAASLLVVIVIFVIGKLIDLRRLCRRKQEYSSESRRKYDVLLRM